MSDNPVPITYDTEDTAKQKWCPMARVALQINAEGSVGKASYNRRRENGGPSEKHSGRSIIGDENISESRCLASGCMMWRWDIPKLDHPTTGHCGLARKGYL